MKRFLKGFIIVLSSAVCCFCLAYLAKYCFEIYNTARQAESLEKQIEENMDEKQEEYIESDDKTNALEDIPEEELQEEEETAEDEKEPVMLSQFEELYEKNPDIVGWVKIDETSLSYPVMQNDDGSDFYLSHDFEKKENINGLPMLDKKCDIEKPSTNLILHGHNMKSGLIFGDLKKYREEKYYKEHPVIKFNTLYEKAEYDIIAVFVSKVYKKSDDVFKYYNFVEAETEEELEDFITNIRAISLYEIEADVEFGDSFVTLSTCEYTNENGRLVIVGRKKK